MILHPDNWHAWLTAPLTELSRFDRRYPAELMTKDATVTLGLSGEAYLKIALIEA